MNNTIQFSLPKRDIMIKYINFFYLIIIFHQLLSGTCVHVFGDSHASFCFSNERTAIPRDENSYYNFSTHNQIISMKFNIHWFGSKTMFSIGRDGLDTLSIKDLGVQENDVAVFVFGEIDARCHIGKQRDVLNRELHEVIETLAKSYINAIKNNKKQFNNVYCVIVSVMPPTNNTFNASYPYHGTIEDRAMITKQLNQKLQKLCIENSITFLDVYSLYANHEGVLDNERSDKVVHVNPHENDLIKQKLFDDLTHTYNLFNSGM